MKNNSLTNNILLLIGLTVFLKLIGFASRSIVAYFYGASRFTDIYYTASGFIDSIAAIILAGLTVGVVNIYLQSNKKEYFISNLISLIVIIMMVIGSLIFLLSDMVSNILMPGCSNDTASQLSLMLKMLSITFPLQGLIAVFGAVLQAEKSFAPVKITGTITSITNILCASLLVKKCGINALVIAYIFGTFFNAFFLFLHVKKNVLLS